MDIAEARAVLGVAETDAWEVVRLAYRRRIRAAHPDTLGVATSPAAVRINEAYAVLSRAKRAGLLGAGGPAAGAPPPASPPPAPPAVGVEVVGGDTLLLAAPPDEAFALLLEAGHRVGNVSYVDRSCAIFEVVVRQDGETCSLVVTLQGRAHGTEAFVTLEALERPASLPPGRVVARLAAALP
ncbi:MAG TPA: J domain-containing protein [Acidimicrobiales bacterium]